MTLSLFLTFAIFSFFVWRVTRYLMRDSMLEETRFKVEHYFGSRSDRFLYRKINELISCPWCVSVWVAGGLTVAWRLTEGDGVGWFWTVVLWVATAAGAMACWQTWEEDD